VHPQGCWVRAAAKQDLDRRNRGHTMRASNRSQAAPHRRRPALSARPPPESRPGFGLPRPRRGLRRPRPDRLGHAFRRRPRSHPRLAGLRHRPRTRRLNRQRPYQAQPRPPVRW
jgi:hypothetical protein